MAYCCGNYAQTLITPTQDDFVNDIFKLRHQTPRPAILSQEGSSMDYYQC